MAIDVATVLSLVVGVASPSAALANWLARKFTEISKREFDTRLENLSNAFIQFSEALR